MIVALARLSNGLLIAFGIGVWMSAGDRRSLRAARGFSIARGVIWFLWLAAPMARRGDIAAGAGGSNDVFT